MKCNSPKIKSTERYCHLLFVMLNSCEAAVEITAVNKVVLFILLHEVILKLRSFWNLRVETCRYSNRATDYFFHVVKLFTQAIHRIFMCFLS